MSQHVAFWMLGLLAVPNLAAPICSAQTVTRGPYLQRTSSSAIVVRWRTDVASTSRVLFGPAPDQLDSSVEDPASVTEHEIEVTGLSPEMLGRSHTT